MSDPLAPFRKRPASATPHAAAISTEDRGGYVAFDAKDRVERLKIHRANNPSRSPFGPPLDVMFDGEFGTNFVLMWDFLIVEVVGRNLQEVVHAIQNGTCDFIQEFDRDRWDMPKDNSAAFIESITVHVPDRMSASDKNEPARNQK
jgi:hypothetical protein